MADTAPLPTSLVEAADDLLPRILAESRTAPVVLYVSTAKNPSCAPYTPLVHAYARSRPSLSTYHVDGDAAVAVLEQFEVGAYPTTLVIRNGTVAWLWEQPLGAEDLATTLDRVCAGLSEDAGAFPARHTAPAPGRTGPTSGRRETREAVGDPAPAAGPGEPAAAGAGIPSFTVPRLPRGCTIDAQGSDGTERRARRGDLIAAIPGRRRTLTAVADLLQDPEPPTAWMRSLPREVPWTRVALTGRSMALRTFGPLIGLQIRELHVSVSEPLSVEALRAIGSIAPTSLRLSAPMGTEAVRAMLPGIRVNGALGTGAVPAVGAPRPPAGGWRPPDQLLSLCARGGRFVTLVSPQHPGGSDVGPLWDAVAARGARPAIAVSVHRDAALIRHLALSDTPPVIFGIDEGLPRWRFELGAHDDPEVLAARIEAAWRESPEATPDPLPQLRAEIPRRATPPRSSAVHAELVAPDDVGGVRWVGGARAVRVPAGWGLRARVQFVPGRPFVADPLIALQPDAVRIHLPPRAFGLDLRPLVEVASLRALTLVGDGHAEGLGDLLARHRGIVSVRVDARAPALRREVPVSVPLLDGAWGAARR